MSAIKFDEHFKPWSPQDCENAASLIRQLLKLLAIDKGPLSQTIQSAATDMEVVAKHLREFREWCEQPTTEETHK